MEYTLKPVQLGARMKINDAIYRQEVFTAHVLACRNGLDTLSGDIINAQNVEEKLNELSTEDIIKIGNEIIEAMNFPKKKNSKSGS